MDAEGGMTEPLRHPPPPKATVGRLRTGSNGQGASHRRAAKGAENGRMGNRRLRRERRADGRGWRAAAAPGSGKEPQPRGVNAFAEGTYPH